LSSGIDSGPAGFAWSENIECRKLEISYLIQLDGEGNNYASNKRHIPMAIRSKHTWYVSFETPPARAGEKRSYSRTTRTFQDEGEAKDFTREKLRVSRDVSAGTLNPFLPKRVITSAQVYEWLDASLSGEGKDLRQTASAV
jgi:hypothetical protein